MSQGSQRRKGPRERKGATRKKGKGYTPFETTPASTKISSIRTPQSLRANGRGRLLKAEGEVGSGGTGGGLKNLQSLETLSFETVLKKCSIRIPEEKRAEECSEKVQASYFTEKMVLNSKSGGNGRRHRQQATRIIFCNGKTGGEGRNLHSFKM